MATNYRDKIKKSTGFRFNLKTVNLFQAKTDIYNEVAEIYDKKYRRDIDDDFGRFADAHCKCDDELMNIISTFIAVNSVDSDYTKMQSSFLGLIDLSYLCVKCRNGVLNRKPEVAFQVRRAASFFYPRSHYSNDVTFQ